MSAETWDIILVGTDEDGRPTYLIDPTVHVTRYTLRMTSLAGPTFADFPELGRTLILLERDDDAFTLYCRELTEAEEATR